MEEVGTVGGTCPVCLLQEELCPQDAGAHSTGAVGDELLESTVRQALGEGLWTALSLASWSLLTSREDRL